MNQNSLILEGIYQFQSRFSKMIKDLQDEAHKYNKCFDQAYKDILDYYNRLSQLSNKMDQQKINNFQEQLQCNNSVKTLGNKCKQLSEQLNIFNENVLQYQMQKLEFDNYYQYFQLSFIDFQEYTPYLIQPQIIASPVQLDFVKSLTLQLNSIVNQQSYQSKKNEQLSNYVFEQTNQIKTQIEFREQQEKLIKEKIEEHQRQKQEIKKQKEELEQTNHIDVNQLDYKYTEFNDNFENLSETEELTQLCQECGQIIKFNNFLTQCLHYYHEECILQKIKANYQQTSIYCSCNTLINSRMIKDVLEQSKQDQHQISFEIFQQYQIKQLLRKSNKNFTECKCGFLYISEKEEQLDICIECEKCD